MSENNNLLLDGIIADANSKAALIIKQAQESADKLIKEAHFKADHDSESEKVLLELKRKQLELKKEGDKNNIDRVYSLKLLDTSYEAVLKLVEKEWSSTVTSPTFSAVLVNWIAEAAIGLNLPQAKVAFSPKSPVTKQMLKEAEAIVLKVTNSSVSLQLDDTNTTEGGVVVSSLDSKISYNNLISVRTRRFQREIKKIVQDYTCNKAE